MNFKFLSIIITTCALALTISAQKIDEPLRQELLKMETEDQRARKECAKNSNADEQIKCYAQVSQSIDAANTRRLNEIFEKFGFPDTRLVGKDGFDAFMLLLQHSISDDLRVKSLKPIEKAFQRRELSAQDYANFVDRLRVHQGKPQIYGQSFSIIDGKLMMDKAVDSKNLDARRRKIGLPPIAEYAKILKEMYHLEVEMPKFQ